MEYYDSCRGRGVVYAFRGSTRAEAVHSFVLQGLEDGAKYQVQFHDHSSSDGVFDGHELTARGLRVHLGAPTSSELIFFHQVSRRPAHGSERVLPH